MDCGCKQAAPVHALSLALVRTVSLASATSSLSAPRGYRRSASCWRLRARSGLQSERGNRPRQPALPSELELSGHSVRAEREPRLWQNVGSLETALATGLMLLAGDARGEEAMVVDSGSAVEAASGSVQELVQDADASDLFGSVATSTISLLFVLAAVGLVVVTVGVVYLSISDYREKKEAEKDRESRAPTKVQIEETVATGSGKGFGKKPEKVSKEKARK